MTAIVRPSNRPDVHPGIYRRWVIGTAAEVAATVGMLRHSGELVSASAPQQMSQEDLRVKVLVRVREMQSARVYVRRRPSRRWVKPLAIAGGVAGVLGGLVAGVMYLVEQAARAVASVGSAGLLGGLVVVGLVLVILGAGRRRGVCLGLHCSGCGHR